MILPLLEQQIVLKAKAVLLYTDSHACLAANSHRFTDARDFTPTLENRIRGRIQFSPQKRRQVEGGKLPDLAKYRLRRHFFRMFNVNEDMKQIIVLKEFVIESDGNLALVFKKSMGVVKGEGGGGETHCSSLEFEI